MCCVAMTGPVRCSAYLLRSYVPCGCPVLRRFIYLYIYTYVADAMASVVPVGSHVVAATEADRNGRLDELAASIPGRTRRANGEQDGQDIYREDARMC